MIYTNLFEKERVSYICYGTLSLSNLQNDSSVKSRVELLDYAYCQGINFFDTAELYDNYDILKEFIKDKDRETLIIATKSYAYDRQTADYSIEKALGEMNTDYIDIFMLHEQDNGNNFEGHRKAVDRFMEYKAQGVIKHFGISTHRVEAVLDSVQFKEIDVVFPIYNIAGIGIQDGTREDMAEAIKKAKANGKFIFTMKPYGGGHLLGSTEQAFKHLRSITDIDSVAVGMRSLPEIDANICYLKNNELNHDIKNKLRKQKRTLYIDEWCVGCGKCVEKCSQKALSIVDGKCVVDMERCVLCSYCAGECNDFYIKIV